MRLSQPVVLGLVTMGLLFLVWGGYVLLPNGDRATGAVVAGAGLLFLVLGMIGMRGQRRR